MAGKKRNGEPGELHGMSRINGKHTPTYALWCNIKQRCHNPNNPSYEFYGGRGITMCERWRESFAAFVADAGERPGPEYSLDRIDNERGYEPGNVRWTTHTEQMRNCRHTKLTLEDAKVIREVYADRDKTTRKNGASTLLAREFGVSRVEIWAIVAGKIFKE